MAVNKKIDNKSLISKVAIRQWLLEKMGITEVRLLETCTGLGKVWTEMEKHVTIQSWVKCDSDPRSPGTLKLTAAQAEASMPLDEFNVVDIDPYGEQWAAYLKLAERIEQPTAVFLTHGWTRNAVTRETITAMGIPKDWPFAPLKAHISGSFVADWCLRRTWAYANIALAGEIRYTHHGHVSPDHHGHSGVSYYAIALEPK